MPEIRWNPRSAGVLAAALLLPLLATGTHAADRYWPPIVDPATGQFTPGRWVWADLVTADVAVAADFYSKVFGWTFETYGGDDRSLASGSQGMGHGRRVSVASSTGW